MPQLVGSQGLRDDVSRMQVRVDVLQVNTFSDEMIVHFDVLSLSMKQWVPRQVNATHVVGVEEDQISDGNVQILENPLESYKFTCDNCRVPMSGLCARECDCRLLLTAPRNRSIAEGEDECGSSVRFVARPIRICVSFESNGRVRLVHDVVIHRSTDIP